MQKITLAFLSPPPPLRRVASPPAQNYPRSGSANKTHQASRCSGLRAGNKLSAIENLGVTEVRTGTVVSATASPCHLGTDSGLLMQNQFDSIDLTDNAITRLEGFPRLHRLRTLLLSNNRINRISPRLEGELCQKPPYVAPAWLAS